MTLDDILQQHNIAECLSTFQYSIKLCKSQDEEMSLIGALWYGFLFLYHEDLLLHIIAHPHWVDLKQGCEKPILLDLVVKPFRGSSKSVHMIFVRAEHSKNEEARNVLQEIYDGSKKPYPRGDMLFFIPFWSKLEDYTHKHQRDKFIFNHEKYLGEEDCIAIFGF